MLSNYLFFLFQSSLFSYCILSLLDLLIYYNRIKNYIANLYFARIELIKHFKLFSIIKRKTIFLTKIFDNISTSTSLNLITSLSFFNSLISKFFLSMSYLNLMTYTWSKFMQFFKIFSYYCTVFYASFL